MSRRRLTALASAAAAIALLAPAAQAGAGPAANASGEEQLQYLTTGKLKVSSQINIQYICAANCSVTSTIEFVIPGPNFSPPPLSGSFAGGTVIQEELTPNKSLRSFIKKNKKKSKLRSEVTATNLLTGEIDTDSQTFKFK